MTVPGETPATQGGETPPPPAAPNTPPAPVQPGADGEPFDAARAQRTIDALRAEVRDLKPKAQAGQTAQQRLQDLEDAQKTDLEKAQSEVAKLQAKLDQAETGRREALIRAAVEREAHAQGAVKADVVYRLLDRSSLTIDDATSEVSGADRAVKALLEAEPYLKAQQTTGTAPIPTTPRPNGQGPTREQLIADKEAKLRASGSYSRL